ncbi:polycystic kidney disease 2-like 2 protein [Photinus pyralis]|uniref:polycystic kidney disease 2-like 2 protein n=1 Tax=Photinus pyralis TaxID=7054 RepID=UPI00126764CA|nr:polycystic kidney disease 2-like 2 protein [Photinus pyralis]
MFMPKRVVISNNLWVTTELAELYEQDEYEKVYVRELVLHLLFLIITTTMVAGSASPSNYYHHMYFQNFFTESPFNSSTGVNMTFHDIFLIGDVWAYLDQVMLNSFYWDKWYENLEPESNRPKVPKTKIYDNILLGVPRLRQLRVGNRTCDSNAILERITKWCYGSFSSGNEDRTVSEKNRRKVYSSSTGGLSYYGSVSSYHTGGFIIKLLSGNSKNYTHIILQDLRKDLWIDRGTRALFLEFTVYNANVNLFCIAKVVFEMAPTGGVIPSTMFRSVKLIHFLRLMDFVVATCQVLVAVYLGFLGFLTSKEYKLMENKYFLNPWSYINLFMILTALGMYSSALARMLLFNFASKKLHSTDNYVNLESASLAQVIQDGFAGGLIFFVYMKLFKYLRVSKIMGQLNLTFTKCLPEIISFGLIFAIIFAAFGIFAHLAFGNKIAEYHNVGVSMFTLMRTVLGDFDYAQLQAANQYVAPVFYLVYVFVIIIIILNMFLALINDTYADVNTQTLYASKRITDYEAPKITCSIAQIMKHILRICKRCRKKASKEPVKEISARGAYEKTTEELRYALLRCGFKLVETDMFFERFNVDPTSSIGQFDATKLMADLKGKPYDLSRDKAVKAAIIGVEDIERYEAITYIFFPTKVPFTLNLRRKRHNLHKLLNCFKEITKSKPPRYVLRFGPNSGPICETTNGALNNFYVLDIYGGFILGIFDSDFGSDKF